MYHVSLAFQCIYGCSGEIGEIGDEEDIEWILPGLLYADDLVFCGESEEDIKAMVGRFVEVYKEKRCESQCR